jgi:NADP-dependent 3-hydroxy acid dehydrogenase YdfG
MKDKVIVITGASTGIGAAVARTVVARGGKVVLAARREKELGEIAGALGANALAVVTDVTRRSDNERLCARAIEKFGHVDCWINNAGRGISRTVSQLTDADVDDMMTTNLKSVLYGIQSVLPHFKQRGTGQIMTVSSMLSRLPLAAQRSAYSAAKAAVNLLMGSLRMELRAEFPGIHVTTVLPGVVATDFGANAMHGGIDSRQIPGAQPVDEVAIVMADAIEKPRAEVYTRPQMHEMQARYFSAEDVAVLETQPPFFASPPRTT